LSSGRRLFVFSLIYWRVTFQHKSRRNVRLWKLTLRKTLFAFLFFRFIPRPQSTYCRIWGVIIPSFELLTFFWTIVEEGALEEGVLLPCYVPCLMRFLTISPLDPDLFLRLVLRNRPLPKRTRPPDRLDLRLF
jgi:hypothetical protein